MLAKYGVGWASEPCWGEPHNRGELTPEERATLAAHEAATEAAE